MGEFASYEFLRLVLDTMPGKIVVRDGQSVIHYANRAFAAPYGKTESEVLGMRNSELWAAMGRPPEQIEQWLGEDREIISSGVGLEYVQEIVRANGERAYFHNFKECLVLPGGRRLLLAQYADITERKRMEQRLAEAEALAAELAGIRKASVTYAHEINNPLTGIIGLAQLMLDHADCPEEFQELLDQLREAALRIAAVTARLQSLDSSKTRAYLGRQELLDLAPPP